MLNKMENEINSLETAKKADEHTETKNDPLTLEELQRMDGEPVFAIDGAGNQCWCLVNADYEECIDNETGAWVFAFYGLSGDGVCGLDKQIGWHAYRAKPVMEGNHAE